MSDINDFLYTNPSPAPASDNTDTLNEFNFDDLMYKSGLTAQGCWDQMDDYDRSAIMKFAELIVRDCLEIVEDEDDGSVDTRPVRWAMHRIKKHFGVEE